MNKAFAQAFVAAVVREVGSAAALRIAESLDDRHPHKGYRRAVEDFRQWTREVTDALPDQKETPCQNEPSSPVTSGPAATSSATTRA